MNHSTKKLILVADDDAMNREIMEAFLLSEDYDVLLTHNGESALRMINAQQPDLIILDVKMSDMDGYEVCKMARRNCVDVPIMIVTGFDSPQDYEQARLAGASLFYPRPFDGADFLAQVHRLLQE